MSMTNAQRRRAATLLCSRRVAYFGAAALVIAPGRTASHAQGPLARTWSREMGLTLSRSQKCLEDLGKLPKPEGSQGLPCPHPLGPTKRPPNFKVLSMLASRQALPLPRRGVLSTSCSPYVQVDFNGTSQRTQTQKILGCNLFGFQLLCSFPYGLKSFSTADASSSMA